VSTPPVAYRLTVFLIDDALANPWPADTGVGLDAGFVSFDAGIGD
jgi:hypothetical protein